MSHVKEIANSQWPTGIEMLWREQDRIYGNQLMTQQERNDYMRRILERLLVSLWHRLFARCHKLSSF